MNIFGAFTSMKAEKARDRIEKLRERHAMNIQASAELENAISTKVFTFNGIRFEDLSRDELMEAAKMSVVESEYWRDQALGHYKEMLK